MESFPTLGLSFDAPDALIWRTCQSEELVLITGNRNSAARFFAGVIQNENGPDSLPVVTIANVSRVLRDRSYAEKVAERLLDYLMRIDDFRGAGRIYVP